MSCNALKRNSNLYDVEYKIIIIGESKVGKSSLLKRLRINQFNENTISTVGLDFVNFYHRVDNIIVKLQIWDTAGQERFRTITRSHFRNTKGILFTFDISNKNSFDLLEYWFHTLEDDGYLDFATAYLIGNKCDLEKDREISFNDANDFANKNLVKYFETSAKTSKNVREMFESLALDLLDSNDMDKMERYKRFTQDSFVYSYIMPKEINLDTMKPIKQKRNIANLIFFRKFKSKTTSMVTNTNECSTNKSKTNKIKDKNQMELNTKKTSTRIKLHDKHNKLNINCCKVS